MKTLVHRLLFLIMVLCCGCSFKWQWGDGSSFDDSTASGDGQASPLPKPKLPGGQEPVPSGDEPTLDEAQQARQAEVDKYILAVVYGGGQIVASYLLPSGDIVDFISRDSLPPLPYELPPLPFAPEDLMLPAGVELGLTELEQFPELVAWAATATPFHRPTYWPYVLGLTDATSIEDYLSRYQLGGRIIGEEHLYAGIQTLQQTAQPPIYGITGYINQFRPEVEDGSFSLIELAVGCPPDEVVGVVISVDKLNGFGPKNHPYTDGEPRLHVEYARWNPSALRVEYKWDPPANYFIPNPFRSHHPGQTVPVSVVGGTQVEHKVALQHVPVTGDWWVVYNDDWLGYFTGSLFTKLHTGACVAAWYLEVATWKYDPAKPWPKTEGGSGKFPDAGLLKAAYVRNPKYLDNYFAGFGLDARIDQSSKPYNPLCFRHQEVYWGAHRLIVMGGPGGTDQACKGPPPPSP
jgi:hypothetical protein